jgi:hypothetical protein
MADWLEGRIQSCVGISGIGKRRMLAMVVMAAADDGILWSVLCCGCRSSYVLPKLIPISFLCADLKL